MAIQFEMIGEYNEETYECEDDSVEFDTEEQAREAWNEYRRDYIQGESEYSVIIVFFDGVKIELRTSFDALDWDDILEARQKAVEAGEDWVRLKSAPPEKFYIEYHSDFRSQIFSQ